MQQSSATHSLYILLFGGYRRLLHAVNPPRSAFLFQKFGHGTLPTSYLNFILVGKKPAHIYRSHSPRLMLGTNTSISVSNFCDFLLVQLFSKTSNIVVLVLTSL